MRYADNFDDCDDSNPNVHPFAEEICNGSDEDCNNMIDEIPPSKCGISDVGNCSFGIETCENGKLSGCVGAVYPIAELCDGLDNNCNGKTDENLTRACKSYCSEGTEICESGIWKYCDAPQTGTEICDNFNNGCNGVDDEGLPHFYLYKDNDKDGFGNPAEKIIACKATEGYVEKKGDCDDANPQVNIKCCVPGEKEAIGYCTSDVVFAIDDSDSMVNVINAVKAALTDFANAIIKSQAQYDVRLGLVMFKDDANAYGFVSSFTFKDIVGDMIAEGGYEIPEGQLNAVVAAIEMDWKNDAKKYMVLITDAPFHKSDAVSPYSISQAKQMLADAGITPIGIQYSGYNPDLEELTANGLLYPSLADEKFEEIFQMFYNSWKECTAEKVWSEQMEACGQ